MQREYFTPEWILKKIAKRVSRQTDICLLYTSPSPRD